MDKLKIESNEVVQSASAGGYVQTSAHETISASIDAGNITVTGYSADNAGGAVAVQGAIATKVDNACVLPPLGESDDASSAEG